MKLREFDLDVPDVDKISRMKFRSSTRYVTGLYEKCFDGKALASPGWKVLVECKPAVANRGVVDLLGVLTVQTQFALEVYEAASKLERAHLALDALQTGVLAVARTNGWNESAFVAAYEEVKRRQFRNEGPVGKTKSSPDRRLRAELWSVHDQDAFTATLIVRDKAGSEMARQLALREAPNEFVFAPLLGNVEWTTPNEVTLFSKRGEVVSRLRVPQP